MRKFVVPLVLILMVAGIGSCVSKKKFLEMQDGRLKAEQEVRNLSERIATMISDFESMKKELMESNAIKDQYIDSLNLEITKLSGSLTKQDQSLAEKEFTLGFEKRRLSNELSEREKEIGQLNLQLKSLQNDLNNRSKELDEKKFDLNVTLEKVTMLETDKNTANLNLSELQGKLKQAQNEVSQLRNDGRKKDETITRLENNVRLLKQEMEKK